MTQTQILSTAEALIRAATKAIEEDMPEWAEVLEQATELIHGAKES